MAANNGNKSSTLALRDGATVTPRNVRTKQTYRARAKTTRWQRAFFHALRQTPNVQAACKSAGIARSRAYECRDADKRFAAAWQDALGASIDKLEHKAFQLAMAGDSTLITFMLRCHKPELYRDVQKHEVGLLGGIVFLPAKEKGDE
jgi:hypothetical protein